MRTGLIIALTAALSATPLAAQEEDGKSMMERGMELFFDGLKDEMSPALRDLRGLAEEFGPPMRSFLEEMGPAMAKILEEVKDWSRYEAPEILPNGDIIIRRKPEPGPGPGPGPEETEPLPPAGPTDI